MNIVKITLLYACLSFGANTVSADIVNLLALANNDLAKIRFHREPKTYSELGFEGLEGTKISLSDFKGKFTILNFWALWCAPCVEEMPALDKLKGKLHNNNFEVIAVAMGRNSKDKINNFYKGKNLKFLGQYFDPTSELARKFKIKGLPTTIIINREGEEVGRVEGVIDWNSSDSEKLFLEWLKVS